MNILGHEANFQIVENNPDKPLIIKDLGPWDRHPTVTNDAESVVEQLFQRGLLSNGRKLYCIDSNEDMDELEHQEGVFTGFKFIKVVNED